MESASAASGAAGESLNRLAVSATTPCLTGCAIGELAGMAIEQRDGRADSQRAERGAGRPSLLRSIAAGFARAYPVAYLANRYLIARGKGHARVHEHHGH